MFRYGIILGLCLGILALATVLSLSRTPPKPKLDVLGLTDGNRT